MTDRLCSELKSKVMAAECAASLIPEGSVVGFSGFSVSGTPNTIARAIAAQGTAKNMTLITGASVSDELDGGFADAEFLCGGADRGPVFDDVLSQPLGPLFHVSLQSTFTPRLLLLHPMRGRHGLFRRPGREKAMETRTSMVECRQSTQPGPDAPSPEQKGCDRG